MTVKTYSSGWQIAKTIRAYANGTWQKIKTLRIYRGDPFFSWSMVYPDVPRFIGSTTLTTSRPGGIVGFAIPGDTLSFGPGVLWSQLDYEFPDTITFLWQKTINTITTTIPGQTSSSYVVQASDVFATIRSQSTASNERGATTMLSAASNLVVDPSYIFAFNDSNINVNANAFISFDNISITEDIALVSGKSLRYWSGDYIQHSLFYKSDSTTFRIYHQLIGASSGGVRDLGVVIVFTSGSNIAEIFLTNALTNTADIFGAAPWRAYQFDGTGINSYQTHIENYKYNVPMTYGSAVTSSASTPYPTSDIPTLADNVGWIRLTSRDGQDVGGTSIQLRSNMFIPTNITTLTSVRSGENQMTISWSGSNANSYKYLITSSGGTLASGNTTTTSIIISGAVVGTTYTISVTPNSRSDVTGQDGNVNTITYVHPGLPSAPVISATPTSGQISISWTAPSNGGSPITDYIIEYKLNSSSTWIVQNDGVNTNTSYAFTNLTKGSSYNFRVAAVNAYGSSAYSNIVTETFATVPGLVSNIGGTTSVSSGNISRTVTWTAPADNGGLPITQYDAALGTSTTGPWGTTNSNFGNPPATSTTFSSLLAGTTYYARVIAWNARGQGVHLVSGPFTTPNVPSAPTFQSGIRGDKQITLSWSVPSSDGGSSILDYTVQYKLLGTADSTYVTASSSITSTSYTVTGLTNGTGYTFRVRARNAVGSGAWSATINRSPAAAPIITSVTANKSGTSITVTWSVNANGSTLGNPAFRLQRQLNGGAWGGELTYPSTTTTQFYASLPAGTHRFRVQAISTDFGTGAYTESNSVTI